MPKLRSVALATALAAAVSAVPAAHAAVPVFEPSARLLTDMFPEAISVSPDGKTVAASDPGAGIFLVDIADPAKPRVTKSLPGRQTAVAYTKDGKYLLAVDQRQNRTDTIADEDKLRVLDATTLETVRRLPISGGDAVTVSPDGRYAAISDEQTAGFADGAVVVVDIDGREPAAWTTRRIELPERADARYTKPGGVTMNVQPEYADIRPDNVAVVSLQDQNAFALVDLAAGTVQKIFNAGDIDTFTLDEFSATHPWSWQRPIQSARFPDSVAWLPDGRHFLAASEGENDFILDGQRVISEGTSKSWGGRSYTLYDSETGAVVWESGLAGEQDAARRGVYPDSEAADAAMQYEGVDVARYGDALLGFAVAERGDQLHVLDLAAPTAPRLSQILPTGSRPEYVAAIPERDLLVASGESGGLSVYRVVPPGAKPRVDVVAEDPSFAFTPGYGTTNPVSLTYDDLGDGDPDTGRVIFNSLQGALSVDPDKPLGPNAARLYDNSHDVLPDGTGGHWIRFSDQRMQHRDRNGAVLVERANTGWEFGGERIGGRTFNAFYGAVSVYDLAAGTALGFFEVKLPGRNGLFEDAAVTPGGDLLFAETDPQTFGVELFLVRDPETIPMNTAVTAEFLTEIPTTEFKNRAGTPYRIAVGDRGQVWLTTTKTSFQDVGPVLPASVRETIGGTVPATLSLTLGAPASFGAFQPGVARTYEASTTATVISTGADAALAVSDPSTTHPGHLVNGAFALPQPLQGLGTVKTWDGPASNEAVAVRFEQAIGATDALRTGAYAKTLTFTLSTTAP